MSLNSKIVPIVLSIWFITLVSSIGLFFASIGVSSDEKETFISSKTEPLLSIVETVRTIGSSFFNVI